MHHVQPTAPIPSPNLLIAAALALSPARSELALIGLGLGRTFCYSRAEYPIRQEIKTTCKALVHIFQAHDKHTDWFRRLSGGGGRRG